MSNYVISTDVNGSFEVLSGQINTTQTSLKLIGRGAAGYGYAIAENTIKHLSNFASPNAPLSPLKGQQWWDATHQTMKVYVDSTIGWAEMATASSTLANSQFVTKTELYGVGGNANDPLLISKGGTGLSTLGTPGQILRVKADGTGFEFVNAASALSSGNSGSGYLMTGTSTAPDADNTIELGTTVKRFKTIYAYTFNGVSTSAQYADLAERYEASEALEAGDVVQIGGDKEICKAVGEYNTDVFGVISTSPAFKMNSEAGSDETHPYVALAGRVPVKVMGKAKKGQRLVNSSVPGVAIAVDLTPTLSPFSVIGRVLADKNTDDVGMVEAALGTK